MNFLNGFYPLFTLHRRVSPRNLICCRPSMSARNFSKVDNGRLRFRKSWSRAPADIVEPGHPLDHLAPATRSAAHSARVYWDAAGADGGRHGRFDDSFYSRLRAHRPTVNERSRSSRIPGDTSENGILSSTKVRACSADRGGACEGDRRRRWTVFLGCSGDRAPDELVPVNLKA